MGDFEIGDLVKVYFPYMDEDNKRVDKYRPVLILETEGDFHYGVAGWGTDKSDWCPGIRVVKDSMMSPDMNLEKDTFFDCQEYYMFKEGDIDDLMGTCSTIIMDRVREIITENGTKRP